MTVLLFTLVPPPVPAAAEPGALTPAGCIQDVGHVDCGVNQQGLDGARGVAVSSDGLSVYAASIGDEALVRFDRDVTGALTPAGCIQDVGLADCGVNQQGLAGGESVAVSPDGRSVYVAGQEDDAIVRFDRDTATGALTPAGCIQDVGLADCGVNQHGLDGAMDVAVSPDGISVYVAGENDDAIVRFDRDTTGALTPAGCIQDVGKADCGVNQHGLDRARSVAVSPDGSSVYVGSGIDDAIVRFDRDTTGALTPAGCIQDEGLADCGVNQQGLDGANGVAVSADGTSTYVVSEMDDAVVRFDRDTTTGALTPAGCIQDTGKADCGVNQPGLDGANGVAVSADGLSVYVESETDDAVVRFERNTTTGALTPAGCIQDTGKADCGVNQEGLDGARAIAVSSSGSSVYVASGVDDAVVRFDRELLDTDPPETSITKGPKKKTDRRKARFRFTSDEPGSTFECRLDKRKFKDCTSPYKVRVKLGKHTFRVRATDAAGNTDPTPAKRRWRVVTG